jgi:hypothetical protein
LPTNRLDIATLHQVQVRSGVSQAAQTCVVAPFRVTGTVGFPHFGQVMVFFRTVK